MGIDPWCAPPRFLLWCGAFSVVVCVAFSVLVFATAFVAVVWRMVFVSQERWVLRVGVSGEVRRFLAELIFRGVDGCVSRPCGSFCSSLLKVTDPGNLFPGSVGLRGHVPQ